MNDLWVIVFGFVVFALGLAWVLDKAYKGRPAKHIHSWGKWSVPDAGSIFQRHTCEDCGLSVERNIMNTEQ